MRENPSSAERRPEQRHSIVLRVELLASSFCVRVLVGTGNSYSTRLPQLSLASNNSFFFIRSL